MPHDAAELAHLLAGRAAVLARELLPNGRRNGIEWRCGSVDGEKGESLSVCIGGGKAGLWADFATGERGDALDLVAAVLHRGDLKQAMEWARRWLGLEPGAAPLPQRQPPPAPAEAARDHADGIALANRIWLGAEPAIGDTPAGLYLLARGIDLTELPRPPGALRFHPRLFHRESGRSWPALVAAVSELHGGITAVHRTWLARDESGVWRKAPVRDPKKSLGRVSGGFIRLARGASGRRMAEAPDGETVVIAEGIETGLSVAVACPELRVVAAVSLANMGTVQLPPSVCTVIVAADNDGDNPAAMRGLRHAMERLADRGHAVRVARSPVGKDFNDALVAAE